ncbi:MAG: hydrogenase maturation nickel metallochaperone HypA [Calditrichia bacterium]
MHELSIAQSIIATVLQEMKTRQLKSIEKIGVEIGAMSGVFPDALQFGYNCIIKDTILENTELVIEKIAVAGECSECGKTFQINDFVFVCPACSSPAVIMTRGNELDIKYLEIAEKS